MPIISILLTLTIVGFILWPFLDYSQLQEPYDKVIARCYTVVVAILLILLFNSMINPGLSHFRFGHS